MKSIEADYAALLGREIRRATNVAGGDIGASVRLECADGSVYFAKRYPGGEAGMATAEASGLEWIEEARALRVPKVIAASGERSPMLILEWIEQRAPAPDFDERLGRGLASLHAAGAPHFGFPENNFIGALSQSNKTHARWCDFYARERIEPQLEMARSRGLLPDDLDRSLVELIDTLDQHCGPDLPPARLHGDLWSGNLLADERGQPCLIDPAVFAGHPEVDLSMLRLFGGVSERVFDAYREMSPLPAGHAQRIQLWQLYPLLVHVNLFGRSYLNAVRDAVRRYV